MCSSGTQDRVEKEEDDAEEKKEDTKYKGCVSSTGQKKQVLGEESNLQTERIVCEDW